MDEPRARVETDENGNMVLIDPDAVAVMRVVAQNNCQNTYNLNKDRIAHFKERAKNYNIDDIVIVIANVDDPNGKILADALMPNYNWDYIRSQGQVPFARGLAGREGVIEFLKMLNPSCTADSIAGVLPVIVVDHGYYAIFV